MEPATAVDAEMAHGTTAGTTLITIATKIDAAGETTATEPVQPRLGEKDATARAIAGTETEEAVTAVGGITANTSAATVAMTEDTEDAIETTTGAGGTTETSLDRDTATKTLSSRAGKGAGAKAARRAALTTRSTAPTFQRVQNSNQTETVIRPCHFGLAKGTSVHGPARTETSKKPAKEDAILRSAIMILLWGMITRRTRTTWMSRPTWTWLP